MRYRPPKNPNPRYKKVAKDIADRIRKGEIPEDAVLSSISISQEYKLKGEQITNLFRRLKIEGLVELRDGEDSRGQTRKRYFVKSPENPQGGSLERR